MLTGCAGTKPNSPSILVGFSEPRHQYHFDDDETGWDVFTSPDQQALFWINGGALEGAVVADRGYIWSLNDQNYQDVSIEATVQQSRGSTQGNGFGLMCRANEPGDGYYFLISSSGQFAIFKGDLNQGADLIPLVNWQPNKAIQQGFEPNDLQAVCVTDYLSFSANGQFLAEARDKTVSAGRLGVVLGASGETAWVSYDDIIVRDANVIR